MEHVRHHCSDWSRRGHAAGPGPARPGGDESDESQGRPDRHARTDGVAGQAGPEAPGHRAGRRAEGPGQRPGGPSLPV